MFSESLKQKIPSICTFFETILQKEKLSHAYLLSGSNLPLKEAFAKELTQILNCQTQNACGKCRNCLWLLEDKHPDLPIVLEPDLEKSKKGVVLVKQVQELLDKLRYKSAFYRCILIKKAEMEFLPAESANSLLKTIEEPNPKILFLLYTQDIESTLATIVSRCQTIYFPNEPQKPDEQLLERANFILNALSEPKINWFKISQLASEIISAEISLIDFLDSLTEALIQQKRLSAQIIMNLEKTKSRIKAFCSPAPALEELFWNLKKL